MLRSFSILIATMLCAFHCSGQQLYTMRECQTNFPLTVDAFDSNAVSYLWSTGDSTASVQVNETAFLTCQIVFSDSSHLTDTFEILKVEGPPNTLGLEITGYSGFIYILAPDFERLQEVDSVLYEVDYDSSSSHMGYLGGVTLVFPWGSPQSNLHRVNIKTTAFNACGTDTLCTGFEVYLDPWSPETRFDSCFDVVGEILGQEEASLPAFSIYPNPTSDVLFVDGVTSSRYQIMGTDGRSILQGYFEESIDVWELAAGVYYLEIASQDNARPILFIKSP